MQRQVCAQVCIPALVTPFSSKLTCRLVRAGPRPRIYFNPITVNAAIVTCGGLCPGLNDVVRQVGGGKGRGDKVAALPEGAESGLSVWRGADRDDFGYVRSGENQGDQIRVSRILRRNHS